MTRGWFLLAAITLTAGCSPLEVEKAVTITDVHTGWYDAGIMPDGKNKLVPSISLKLRNMSDEEVASVQLNAIFRRVNESEAWGEHYVMAIPRELAVAPGGTTRDIVLRSNLGYTGTQSRLQMLQNKEFVDAKVDIFGKSGSRTWVKLAEYPIGRQLLTE